MPAPISRTNGVAPRLTSLPTVRYLCISLDIIGDQAVLKQKIKQKIKQSSTFDAQIIVSYENDHRATIKCEHLQIT